MNRGQRRALLRLVRAPRAVRREAARISRDEPEAAARRAEELRRAESWAEESRIAEIDRRGQ